MHGFEFNAGKPNPLQLSGEKKWNSGDYKGALKDSNKALDSIPSFLSVMDCVQITIKGKAMSLMPTKT